jgi:hypothetical protein
MSSRFICVVDAHFKIEEKHILDPSACAINTVR